jgi:hypothetical protein
VLVLAAFLCCTQLPGDEPRQPAQTPAPLPRHYRKLGLDKDQTDKVRTTQAEYQARIDKLRQQLRELQKEADAELEKLLTADQKARLKELQAQGPGTFKISAPSMPMKVYAGKPRTFGVELTHDKAFDGDVKLTYLNLPKGIAILPDPYIFKEGGDPIAELTIRTDKNLASGEYRFTIVATPNSGEPAEVTVELLVLR